MPTAGQDNRMMQVTLTPVWIFNSRERKQNTPSKNSPIIITEFQFQKA